MAICIAVKYHGPTNHKGSRFTATVAWGQEKKRATVSRDYELELQANELEAVHKVLDKLNDELLMPSMQRPWIVQPCGGHPTTGESIYRAHQN